MDISAIKYIFLPSSLVLIFLFTGVLVYFLKKKEWGKFLIGLGIAVYFLFSTFPGSNLVIGPLEDGYFPVSEQEIHEADKIVVLSGGKKADTIRRSEVFRIFNLRKDDMEVIISGTESIRKREESETAIGSFFVDRGVPAEKIKIEDRSINTRENAERTFEKIGETPFFLVTSAYHMERAVREFERVGANPIPAPTDFRKAEYDYGLEGLIPRGFNLRKSDLAFYEYFGIAYYQVLDWID